MVGEKSRVSGKCYFLVNIKLNVALGKMLGWVLNKASSFQNSVKSLDIKGERGVRLVREMRGVSFEVFFEGGRRN